LQEGLPAWLLQSGLVDRCIAPWSLEFPHVSALKSGDHYPRYPFNIAIQYTLWLFNIAMENGPFIDGLAIKNGDFPWLC
jgi:hypothetical protein